MNPEWAKNTIKKLQTSYKPILDQVSDVAFETALATLDVSYERFQQGKEATWGYKIYDEAPIRFKPSPETGYDPVVDVYCDIRWNNTSGIPVKQDIVLRIWCNADQLGYREEFDSLTICDSLTTPRSYPGRVVSRFHFDRVNHEQNRSRQYHPRHHMQVGGNAPSYELCWFPTSFDLPRISHHPMELFLTCQLIAANFFTESYAEIRDKGDWRTYLLYVQDAVLTEYYTKCLDIIRGVRGAKQSLLDQLEESAFDPPTQHRA